MKEPVRPSGIPADAEWNSKEKEWQLGEKSPKKTKHPIGMWQYWRSDGSLCSIAHFDRDGRLDGTLERFHEDGSLAFSGVYKAGSRAGKFTYIQSKNPSSEYYPADENTWRYEFQSSNNWSESGLRWFLEDGRECTSRGKAVEEAYDLDEAFASFEPENFITKHGKEVKTALEIEDYPDASIRQIENLWGSQTEDLQLFLTCLKDTHSFEKRDSIREFEPDKNVWRELISHPRENWHEELASFFMGAIKIGNFGDSDGIYATLFCDRLEKPKANCIYHWSHETYYVDNVIAASRDDFAYRTALSLACEEERLSPEQAKKSWAKLRGKMDVDWAAAAGLEAAIESEDESENELDDEPDDELEDSSEDSSFSRDDFDADLDPKNSIRRFFWRSQWIIYLLADDENRRLQSMEEVFRKDFNLAIDEEKHKKMLSNAANLPLTGIYLIWRYFWFKQKDRLAETCAALENHWTRVVRDLVALMQEIENGSSSFYGIEDILKVRDEFLKLDLCPERESERSIEQAASLAKNEEKRQAVSKKAQDAIAKDKESLLELAWQNIEDSNSIDEIEKSARSLGDPLCWKALDWLDSRGFERDNADMKDEAINLAEELSKMPDADLLQPFAWSRINERYPVAEIFFQGFMRNRETLDKRLIPALVKTVQSADEYKFRNDLALRILNSMDACECADTCSKALNDFADSLDGASSSDLRTRMIPWEEFLISIANCIEAQAAELPEEQKMQLKNIINQIIQICYDAYSVNVAAAFAHALLAIGVKNVLHHVPKLINSGDDREKVSAIELVEKCFPALSKPAQKEFLLGFYNPDTDDCTISMVYQRTLHNIKEQNPDLEITDLQPIQHLLDSMDVYSYGTEGWQLWRTSLCKTVQNRPELSLDLIRDFLESPSYELRSAAECAFRTRGLEPVDTHVCTWMDVWKSLSEDSIEKSNQTLGELLCADSSRERSCIAGWFWSNPSQQNTDAICKALEKRIANYEVPGAGEYIDNELDWMLRALVKHAEYKPAEELLKRIFDMHDRDLNACLLKDIDSFPTAFAKELLQIAGSDDGWQRSYVAKWALAHKDELQIQEAIKASKLTEKKLQKWS